MIKICVVTGSRADYGLLQWTMKAIEEHSNLDLSVCVTGMHLSNEFGLTYEQIEEDGFKIDENIEILLSSDTSVGITKSIGLGLIGFADFYERTKPDWVLILGDRFEILSAATAAMIARIPIAHCHGGETTEGAVDEAIRHSITKMSHLHFTSTIEYKNRVIQLGEQPSMVHSVGAFGIESINKLKLLTKRELEQSMGFKLDGLIFLVTYHPVTLEERMAEEQFRNLLMTLEMFTKVRVIFTKSNADAEGRIINTMIDDFAKKHSSNTKIFSSLGQLRYLSAVKYCNVVIGNSSSGLIEVPSFNKPTVNIGDRQKGRIKADSVISCGATKIEIKKAIDLALSSEHQKKIQKTKNPYGSGNVSEKVINTLIKTSVEKILFKEFYDVNPDKKFNID